MAREEIFGMLRSIYDGSFSKRFGNTERRYNSRFGIVAGVTPAIEIFLTGESALGERFLRYELRLPSSVNEHLRYIERAMDNIEREVEIEGALRDLANTCLDYSFSFSVTIPKEIKAKIMYLALYTSIMRSTLERDKYTKEILFRPFQEAGTRLAKQFMKLLIGICKFRRARTATDSEYRILCNLAAGTVPSREGDIVKYIYKNFRNKSVQLKQVAEKVNLQRTGCSIITTGLCALKVLKKMKETNLFRLTDQIIEIVDRSEIFNRSTSVKKIKKSKKTKIIVRN